MAAHCVVIGDRHTGSEKDLILDRRTAGEVAMSLHAGAAADADLGIDRGEAADGRIVANLGSLTELAVNTNPRPHADPHATVNDDVPTQPCPVADVNANANQQTGSQVARAQRRFAHRRLAPTLTQALHAAPGPPSHRRRRAIPAAPPAPARRADTRPRR